MSCDKEAVPIYRLSCDKDAVPTYRTHYRFYDVISTESVQRNTEKIEKYIIFILILLIFPPPNSTIYSILKLICSYIACGQNINKIRITIDRYHSRYHRLEIPQTVSEFGA